MMYRAKRKLNGDWVYGSLIRTPHEDWDFIVPEGTEYDDFDSEMLRVITRTIGRDTGMIHSQITKTYPKGRKIYEGDVFRSETEFDEGDVVIYNVVTWVRQRAAFYMIPFEHISVLEDNDCQKEEEFDWLFQDAGLYDFSLDIELPLIGNIHDRDIEQLIKQK